MVALIRTASCVEGARGLYGLTLSSWHSIMAGMYEGKTEIITAISLRMSADPGRIAVTCFEDVSR